MNTVRNITFIACGISIVISMLDIITPEGKFKKQIRLIFAIVFIICIINPILHSKIDFSQFKPEDIKETSQYKMVQETFYSSLSENYTDNLEKALMQKLNINEIKPNEIKVNVNISEDNCIDISEVKIVLAYKYKSSESKVKTLIKDQIGDYPVDITWTEEKHESEN